ncbi:acyltransferase family protein [Rhodopirellula sp. MGV]|uniref:acyltransferase family protein n=1 Tax=Rhodopirellula sp. MGV TaxID=2023130 RepID=UPI000B9646F1|nr:acyltransferase [Rhodopirellula sp. MGV]OYP34096.1 hypothetical protein CGZ80_16345 [Rhodopirellula sp. MGV]PNY35609.1 acyltransferase [Rhodopirellula baltica]
MKFVRLEAVRGFAATYVCLGHVVILNLGSSGIFADLFKFGQEAVMVFFILSGFVIAWATSRGEGEAEPFSRYFLKRFTRIYSVWGIAVLAMFLMESIEHLEPVWESPGRLLGNFLMLQDFKYGKPGVICGPVYGATPLWSLHYEWWFYMLFPLVLLLKGAEHRTHMVGMLAILGGVSYALIPNPVSRICLYFGVWWVGVHFATVLRKKGSIEFRDAIVPVSYVLLSTLPLCVLCSWWMFEGRRWSIGEHPLLELRHLVSSVVLVGLAFLWRQMNWLGFRYTIQLFAFVAPISFSLYVLHYKGVVYAKYLGFIGVPLLEFALYVVVTVLLCVFSEIYFYKYFRSWLLPAKRIP